MAIQNRRGDYANFDPQKMKPGEFAIVQSNDPNASDGKAVYICTQAGTVKRLVSSLELYDEVQNAATEIAQEIHEAVDEDVQRAEEAAESAEQSAASLEIDNTLTEHNKVPESYAAGRIVVVDDDEPEDVSNKIWIKDNTNEIAIPTMEDINTLLTNVGNAMLNCFRHVAWINEHGQEYYNTLELALHTGAYPKIIATFDAGLNVIYTDDALNTLKQYLTVIYYETEESSGVAVPSTDYTLHGTLSEGSNTLQVTYEESVASFVVDNVVDFYNIAT